ncbi:hypothetical protein DFH06DRAFT_1197720 [Mycena polygramma]|nr:hypothetical protein DFH06DRAFT_1197720 [Mycena polygramma]
MTMRALSDLPLDDDIVDRIMTFCPTFPTLQALALVSKAFYSVFQTHPKSITRAVAYNIVGPALPQALRVVRYPGVLQDDEQDDERDDVVARDKKDPDEVATACPEAHGASVITAAEKETLQKNSRVVEALEDIYSLTQKDRTSRMSVLTSEESWRFRRAAYRIMLYCNIFSGQHYSFEDIEEMGEDDIKHIQRQRTAVLNEYPTDELLQIYAVARFIRGILDDACGDVPEKVDHLLACGPYGAVRTWEDRSFDALNEDFDFFDEDDGEEMPLYVGFFALPLENIWAARKVKAPKDDEPATKWILDTIVGANDTCSQCPTPGGFSLLTQANWHRAQLSAYQLLKGNLKRNTSVTFDFMTATGLQRDPDALGPWIASVFEGPRADAAWDGWTKDLSYCLPCLVKFLEEHAWRWFLEKRQLDPTWVQPENCWYGYNCRTQGHKPDHGRKLNHLCVPTRGDP